MSLTELKRAMDEATEEERLELALYLRHIMRADDPENAKELGRRIQAVQQGKGVTFDELELLHKELEARER